jgi:hypothetical protein
LHSGWFSRLRVRQVQVHRAPGFVASLKFPLLAVITYRAVSK